MNYENIPIGQDRLDYLAERLNESIDVPVYKNGERMRKSHEIKTWPQYFNDVASGDKNFEVRKDDRNYAIGDELILQEFNPQKEEYTGRIFIVEVTYKLSGGSFGIKDGYCVLGIVPLYPHPMKISQL